MQITSKTVKRIHKLISDSDIRGVITELWKLNIPDINAELTTFEARFNRLGNKESENLVDNEEVLFSRFFLGFSTFVYSKLEEHKAKPILDLPSLPFNLPFKNGYLYAREDIIKEIDSMLKENDILLINGIGGIGKTTTVLSYICNKEINEKYNQIIWIPVFQEEEGIKNAIISNLSHLASANSISNKDLTYTDILNSLIEYGEGNLLVLDSANYSEDILNRITELQKLNWKIIITTREEIVGLPSLFLEKLSISDATEVFFHYLGQRRKFYNDKNSASKIEMLLHNISAHTLLIEIIAKTLLTNASVTLDKLLKITEKSEFGDIVLDDNLRSYTGHVILREGSAKDIKIANYLQDILPLVNLNELQVKYLRYFSIFPSIPLQINELLDYFNLSHSNDSLNQFGKDIQDLSLKGWLSQYSINSFSCHMMIQYSVRSKNEVNFSNTENLVFGLYQKIRHDEYSKITYYYRHIPVVDSVLYFIKDECFEIAQLYDRMSGIILDSGDIKKAKIYDEKNLEIIKKLSSTTNFELAHAYNNKAATLIDLGHFSEAETNVMEAIKIYENESNLIEKYQLSLATAYFNYSGCYIGYGDYHTALRYAIKALKIREDILFESNPTLAESYQTIGGIYKNLNDKTNAIEFSLKSVKIYENTVVGEHEDLASAYRNVGVNYEYFGEIEIALHYFKKSMALSEKLYDRSHPKLAKIYNNIANTFRLLENYSDSLDYFKKAIEIQEKVYDPFHPSFAVSYNNMSFAYYGLGNLQGAKTSLEKAIEVCKNIYGMNHPHTRQSLENYQELLEILDETKKFRGSQHSESENNAPPSTSA